MSFLTGLKHIVAKVLTGPELPVVSGEERQPRSEAERSTMGRVAENEAAWYLLMRGYRILCRNRSNAIGELDIVARKGDTVVFVEVRSRSKGASVQPRDTITREKRQKLVRTAELFARQHRVSNMQQRIDFIGVEMDDNSTPRITEHLKNCITQDGEIG